MFRIVTDFVEQPTLLLMCDERTCGCFATRVLPAGAGEAECSASVIEPFIADVIAAGWVLGFDRHLCPGHVERIANGRRMVQLAHPGTVRLN